MTGPIVIWDVDTQNDFFDRWFLQRHETIVSMLMSEPIAQVAPALGVPGSHTILENLGVLVNYATSTPGYRLMGSVDAHDGTEAHCRKWPAHCIKGTTGQEKINETTTRNAAYVTMERSQVRALEELVGSRRPLYFEKTQRPEDPDPDYCNSVRVNPNVERALELVDPKLIAVSGVVLGYCVKSAVEYFLELGYKVAVITDAIKEFDPNELTLYKEWADRGVLLTNTRTVMSGGLESLADEMRDAA